MNDFTSSKPNLSPDIYRLLLMLTSAWPGTRALPGSLVLKFEDGNNEKPLFWCGGPNELAVISETLAEKRSIYLMRGTYGILPPTQEVIEALGRYYANEITKIEPHGPYYLGGFCEAGFIAYEIAQVLTAQGYQVKMLVMFERDLTAGGISFSIARKLFSLIDKMGRHWKQFKQVNSSDKWGFFKYCHFIYLKRKKPANNLIKNSYVGDNLPIDLANPVIPIPCSKEEVPYSLTAYPGRAVLIYIRWGPFGYFSFRIFQKYWEKIILGGTDFRIVPGWAHYMPNWHLFTEILESLLDDRSENSGQ